MAEVRNYRRAGMRAAPLSIGYGAKRPYFRLRTLPDRKDFTSRRNVLVLASRRPLRAGPVAQWSEPAAHNRLVGGSSPPGPTTHSSLTGDFPTTCEMCRFGGIQI